jgi:polyhydroxyalkanoate depolymerase
MRQGVLYYSYQTFVGAFQPFRALGKILHAFLTPFTELPGFGGLSYLNAAWGMMARLGLTHKRPAFGIHDTVIGDVDVRVHEDIVDATPFASLLHFRKETELAQPRVLLVAPMSGHFATLLRATVRTMLPEHDVYLTDWHNARDVPPSAGEFGIDAYADHVIRFLEKIGPGVHVVAVCQPCVQVLVAVAAMAEDKNPATPRSMTLMAGPIDTKINPTKVNELALSQPIEWFKENLISTVPWYLKGGGRKVYPGFVQLAAFMSMNRERHEKAHQDLFAHMAAGDHAKAQAIANFYDEYFAVADMPAEFYLETVQKVFQEAQLAKGEMVFHGKPVKPSAIRRTALLTIEGERDDICALGQTVAAHDLCTGLKPHLKRHHMQTGVGHYGVFSGSRWEKQIYPIVRNHIVMAHG